MSHPFSRRDFLAGTGALAGASLLTLHSPLAQALTLPKSPVTLNVVDAAGNLALTRPIFDDFQAQHKDLVSRFTFSNAPAPQLPTKVQAQQRAKRVDIDMVIIGPDAMSEGLQSDIWVNIADLPSNGLPDLKSVYLEPAWRMQQLTKGRGVTVTYYPSGPLLEYLPEQVPTVPQTAEELLAWAKQNPKKFIYARPANSGPGRTFLMGLPYLLGDRDPHDPMKGWDKTWAYLKELNQYIEYYPSGTSALMRELGSGARAMTVTTTGWDINPRALGIVPAGAKVGKFKNFHWVCDAHYFAIPKGVSDEKIAVLLEFIKFSLSPKQQAYTYDEGYFYPGPAVKDVTLSMAPKKSQDVIAQYGRPEYADWIANNPIDLPLEPRALVAAFHRWDQEVASSK